MPPSFHYSVDSRRDSELPRINMECRSLFHQGILSSPPSCAHCQPGHKSTPLTPSWKTFRVFGTSWLSNKLFKKIYTREGRRKKQNSDKREKNRKKQKRKSRMKKFQHLYHEGWLKGAGGFHHCRPSTQSVAITLPCYSSHCQYTNVSMAAFQ